MTIRKILSSQWQILLVLALALLVRVIGPFTPPALNWDEVSHGYNAYSILTTGKDEWGVSFPLIFRAYGDYKLPVYIYLTAVSELLFGLTPFAIRLVSVLAGLAAVYFTFLLTKELFPKNKTLPCVSAILVAIEPWSLFMSRAAFEANLAVALIIAGAYFFLKTKDYFKYLPVAVTLLGLSVWTYNTARIFSPLLIAAIGTIYCKELVARAKASKRTVLVALLISIVFFLPMFWQLAHPVGQARYSKVAIIDQGAINKIEHARLTTTLPPSLAKLVFNRPVYFAKVFSLNYLSHFTPAFLGFKGGTQYQFSVPGLGVLFAADLIFIPLGLLYILRANVPSKSKKLLFAWIFLAPIASSLTREAPHVLRASVMLPAPMILSAVGITASVDWLAKRGLRTILVWGVYVLLLVTLLTSYLLAYFGRYRTNYSWSWQYGYKQVVDYSLTHYADYDKIIITKKYGEPHEFVLFYSKWGPGNYRSDANLNRFPQSDWFWVDGFDKYYFVNDWQINEKNTGPNEFVLESGRLVDCTDTKCLLITSPGNVASDWTKLDQVNFLDGTPAFEIYEN